MTMTTFTEIGKKLLIGVEGKLVVYDLCLTPQPVNEQQYNLPEGMTLKYKDGSIFIHRGAYLLIRHWQMPNGEVRDRVAFPWENLQLKK